MSRKTLIFSLIIFTTVFACDLLTGGDEPLAATEAFNPTNDTSLDGGEYSYTELNIPTGVTVVVSSDVVIIIEGSAEIDGLLTGDCARIEMRGSKGLTMDGKISNECSDPEQEVKKIILIFDGDIVLGSEPSDEPIIISSGGVFISDTEGKDLDLSPIFSDESSFFRMPQLANLANAFFVQGGGGSTRVNRPIRAGRGSDVSVVRAQGNQTVNANLIADAGEDAPTLLLGGTCDNSNNIGGTGGSIRLAVRNGDLNIGAGVRLEAGDGGMGGSCISDSGCPATAIAGRGGRGGNVLVGAQNIVFGAGVVMKRGNGGPGGEATAFGDDGSAACEDGCQATATGGMGGTAGGIGYVILEPGSISGAPTVEGANGGKGGSATSEAGDGMDCTTCPGGAGGNGGAGNSTGGQGGDGGRGVISGWAIAANSHLKGDGGDAIVDAGTGGDGADCCSPPSGGGNGGDGGAASATGGQIGTRGRGGGGVRGASRIGSLGAGLGGFGGDGLNPGNGGSEGIGTGDPTDIPDGQPGDDGDLCLVPLSGIYLVDIVVVFDPSDHGNHIQMPKVLELDIIVVFDNGTITIFGLFPWVFVEGTIDALGNFTATGFGSVAGFSGIGVQFEGTITLDGFSGLYNMGIHGGLPGGDLIGYGVTGELVEPSTSDGTGDDGTNNGSLFLSNPTFCRAGPGTEFEQEWTLDAGSTLPVVGQYENGWWLVEVDDSRTRTECCWVGAGEFNGDAQSTPLISSIPPGGSCP